MGPAPLNPGGQMGSCPVLQRYTIRRFGKSNDVAKMAMFLCSEAASWITGRGIPVNGVILFRNKLRAVLFYQVFQPLLTVSSQYTQRFWVPGKNLCVEPHD